MLALFFGKVNVIRKKDKWQLLFYNDDVKKIHVIIFFKMLHSYINFENPSARGLSRRSPILSLSAL